MTSIIDNTVTFHCIKKYAREIRQITAFLACAVITSSIYNQFNCLQDLLGNTNALRWLMGAWVTGVLLLCIRIFIHVAALKKQTIPSSPNN